MARNPYKTLAGIGESELVVERSRFLGLATPVASLDEALGVVARLRAEHYDARHVCFGLRVGHGAQCVDRSNDDGEPARTGGYPLWQLLDGAVVTDALIVVVRYYGGIKLGTGGLARAYRDAGRDAFERAGIFTVYPTARLRVAVAYDAVGKLDHMLGELEGIAAVDREYAADVTYSLDVQLIHLDGVRGRLGEVLQRSPESFDVEETA